MNLISTWGSNVEIADPLILGKDIQQTNLPVSFICTFNLMILYREEKFKLKIEAILIYL